MAEVFDGFKGMGNPVTEPAEGRNLPGKDE